MDAFTWERTTNTITHVTDGNGRSEYPSISDDGRHLMFSSMASNLVPVDTDNSFDVFVWARFAR